MHDGQVFVTGRLKDLVIIRGKNHYPLDVEETVMRAAAELGVRECAAFVVVQEDEEEALGQPMSDTTKESEALRVAKEAFACYVLGDTQGMLQLLHPEAIFRLPGDPRIVPWAGTFVGAEMKRFHERVKDSVDTFHFTVHTIEEAGDKVLVFAHERQRVKATGRIFENDIVGIVTVRDGKIARYLEYSDTAAMQAAFEE